MLKNITPLILTYNEAPNIERTLGQLRWAKDIVVIDSYSTDETVEIAKSFPQVRLFQREFDQHAKMWNFGLQETDIQTEWVLALDADYYVTDELIEEIKDLPDDPPFNGFQAKFQYCVFGRPLRGTLYPPVIVLYRRDKAYYQQDGHTQRVQVDGPAGELKAPILHDDRKPLSRWLQSQANYQKLETDKLHSCSGDELNLIDRLRKGKILAPFAEFFYALFIKRTILDGWAGIYYAFQRLITTALLSLCLIEREKFKQANQGEPKVRKSEKRTET